MIDVESRLGEWPDVAVRRHRRPDLTAGLLAVSSVMVALRPSALLSGVIVGLTVFTLPGIFIASAVRAADAAQRAVVVLTTSVTSWMVLANLLLTVGWWHPRAAVTIGLAAAAVWRQRHGGVRNRWPAVTWRDLATARTAGAVAALALWAIALPAVDLARIDDWGLISALPATYYAALTLAVVVAVSAALDPAATTGRTVVGIAPLLIVIYATLPILSSTIRYPWAYKHVGVIRLLDDTGRLHPHVDIYNNFSGFFGVGALVRGAAGADPTQYGGWAQLAGEAMVLVAVGALAHVATRNAKVARLTVVVYLVTNWVGQNYFAPQTLASLLSITVLALVWSWFTDGSTRRLPFVGRGLDSLAPTGGASAVGAVRWWRRGTVTIVFFGLLLTHPLTPVATIGALAGLVCIGWFRDRALLAMLAGAGLLCAIRVSVYLTDRAFRLGFGGSPTGNAGGNVDYSDASGAVVAVGQLTRLFSLSVWACAVLGALLCVWARRRIGLMLVAALVPFGIPLVQSYGGEAVYRVYLYSLPLMAALIAWGIVALTPVAPRARFPQPTVAATALCLVLAAGFLVAHFGRERINLVDPSEVRMEAYIAANVADPALIGQLAGSYPANATARYPSLQTNDTYTPEVLSMLDPSPTLPPPSVLDEVADDFVALTDGTAYIVVSPGMIDAIHQLNELPLENTDDAVRFLTSNQRFRVVARIDDTVLVEVLR